MTVADTATVTLGTARTPGRRPPAGRRRWADRLSAYGLVAPNMALLTLFVLFPLVDAVVVSFQSSQGFGHQHFVGLANYRQMFGDTVFWRAALNTVLFTALVTPASMAIGLGFALLLNSVLPARGLFRSILIAPMAVSGVATALIGKLIFDENTGLLNNLLGAVGLPAVHWQSGGVAAFASVVIVTLWWRAGINMLVYLAALQGLDPALSEAAELDGAGRWQHLRYVVLPMLSPASVFLLVMNVIYSFQTFDIVYVLTGGGPRNETSLLVTYAYQTGFVTRDQGYAAALGMVLLLFTVAVTAVRSQVSRRQDLL